jgi:hypothetical protein
LAEVKRAHAAVLRRNADGVFWDLERPVLLTVMDVDLPNTIYGATNVGVEPYRIYVNRSASKGRRLVALVHETLHVATSELGFDFPHHQLHVLSVVLVSELLPHIVRLRDREPGMCVSHVDTNTWPYKVERVRCGPKDSQLLYSLARMLAETATLFKLEVPPATITGLAGFIVKVTLPLYEWYRSRMGI